MTRYWLILGITFFILAGCKKGDEEDTPISPTPVVQQTTVKLSFLFRNGSVTASAGTYIQDATGRDVEVVRIRFLVSNFQLMDGSGNALRSFPNAYVQFDSNDQYAVNTLGLADQCSFVSVKLDLGLPAAINAMAPADFNAPPLSDQSLYVNGSLGYRFFSFEGRADANNDGIVSSGEPAVTYICATDAMLRTDQVFWNGSVAGPQATLSLGFDIQGLLNGINVMSDPTETGASALNAQLMSNLQTAVEPS